VRRERPHPGARLSLFDTIEGYRHQVIATDTPLGDGPLTWIEVRHRAHARVEDRIRCGKDSGFGRFPSREYAINQAWLELALTGIDLACVPHPPRAHRPDHLLDHRAVRADRGGDVPFCPAA
jgi:hypothetical protein